MKLAWIVLGLSMAAGVYADELSDLKARQDQALADYRTANKDWNKLPNGEYEKFYSEWAKKGLADELKIHKDNCEKDKKLCRSEQDLKVLEAEVDVAVRVLELRNQYAKENKPNKAEQEKFDKDLERARLVKLCQEFNSDCEKLSQKDRDMVEQLKQRDARISGMEEEFAVKHPNWQEKKADKEVLDFLVRKENLLLSLNLKLNDKLCHAYPKDPEFCFTDEQIAGLQGDTDQKNCLFERIHQLHNNGSGDLKLKEKLLISGHKANWAELEKKDCKLLLDYDMTGKAPVPAPAPAPAPKEEVYGENEDEKDPSNFVAESCEWVTDLPRRVSYLPSCGNKGVCNGYVVCDRKKGGGKFVRLSTCGPENCGGNKTDAVKCTKQGGYRSKKAKGETHEFVSEKLKRMFTSGVTKQ